MTEYNKAEMHESKDPYWEEYLLEEAKKEAEEFEREFQEKLLRQQKEFMSSNPDMFNYLSTKFNNHQNFLSLMQCAVMRAVEQYPNLSDKDYAKVFSSFFGEGHRIMVTADLPKYMANQMRICHMKRNNKSRDWLNMEEFEGLFSHDLAEFASCVLYSKLKTADFRGSLSIFNIQVRPFLNALYFTPLASTKYASVDSFWFKGHIENSYTKESNRGNMYAVISAKEDNGNLIRAVVRTRNVFKLMDGLKSIRNHFYPIALHGKITQDRFEERKILDVDSFVINRDGIYKHYPA